MEKQIEEMACEKCLHFEACRITFRNSEDLGIYDCSEEEYFSTTYDCDYYINKNEYRKASDVVREIFEEIEKMLLDNHIESFKNLNDEWVHRFKENLPKMLADLKKKYI